MYVSWQRRWNDSDTGRVPDVRVRDMIRIDVNQ